MVTSIERYVMDFEVGNMLICDATQEIEFPMIYIHM